MIQGPDLARGLVRFLADPQDTESAIGAGFLVSERHIVTCAHVVAEALGIERDMAELPTKPVYLDWPLVGTGAATAKVIVWHPLRDDERVVDVDDIAILELSGDLPRAKEVEPLPVIPLTNPHDREVRMCGFPRPEGCWTDGKLQGSLETGWVQLDQSLGCRAVEPGFSGTAVWDKLNDAVVGIINCIEERASSSRSAFMIPAIKLIKAWPELEAYNRPPKNPYRGLEAFQEQDAPNFMGRDQDVQAMLEKIEQPFVALTGASGSGKSSLLLAGVIPKLRQRGNWLIAKFRPSGNPFSELAAALVLLLYPDLEDLERLKKAKQLADDFSNGGLKPVEIVDLLLKKHLGQRLLLIIDQFEELYTQNLPIEQRRQFLDDLMAVVQAQGRKPAFSLLVATRIDFLGQLLADKLLAEWVKSHHLLLGPLGQEAVQAAIEKPANQLRVRLEDGLTDRILHDLGEEPGTLPLLQFAMTKLWELQRQRYLTHEAYEAIGGVTQALTLHADKVLTRFPDDQQDRLRRIFLQLVRPGEGMADTRQIATRDQVGTDNWNLVQELANERLVVTGRDLKEQETVEVVHETLIRHWKPLRQWIDQDRQFRIRQNRLRQAMQEWQQNNQDTGSLLRGVRLEEAEAWLQNRTEDLSSEEQAYIQVSSTKAKRQAELERTQLNRAIARQLAAQAALRLDNSGTGLIQSALLAVESLHRESNIPAYSILSQAIALLPYQTYFLLSHQSAVQSIIFSPSGQYIATSSTDKIVRLWDAATGFLMTQLPHTDSIQIVAFSPDSQKLVTASADKIVRLWASIDGHNLACLIHDEWVVDVAFSPDGHRLATASKDKTARLWDISSNCELARLTHNATVRKVVFSSNGQRLATASNDKTARIWDTASGCQLARLAHADSVWSVVFSPDGQRLATASNDRTAGVWDEASGRELARLNHAGSVWNVTFSPDGQRLATASDDGTARIWHATSGRELARLTHADSVWNVKFSPDGQRLATASYDKTARVWNVTSGHELARLIHADSVRDAVFSPDGQRLVTASVDKMVRVWDAMSSRQMIHGRTVQSAVFSPDGQRLFTIAEFENMARLWDAGSGRELAWLVHADLVRDAVFSPDGQRLATASDDRTVRVWDVSSGLQVVQLNHADSVWKVVFSPEGQRLATVSGDRTVRIWEIINGHILAQLTHDESVNGVSFSPNGQHLATASKDKTALIWDIASDQKLSHLSHSGTVWNVVFSPDGQRLTTIAEFENTVRVWDTASGRELLQLTHTNTVSNMVFSPDGQRLATASKDKTARVWDVGNGHELKRLIHDDAVNSVSFNPDGQHLATASEDKTARVWDVGNGHELARLIHDDAVNRVSFNPDGHHLATASGNTARVWVWRVGDLIDRACQQLPRNLSYEEWRQYVGEDVPYHATCPNLPMPEN